MLLFIFGMMARYIHLYNIVLKEIKKTLGKSNTDALTRYELAKGSWRLRKTILSAIRQSLLIMLGVISAAFGLKGFILPNGFIDGGVMGISILTSRQTGISLSILILLISLPFVLLGWHQIGKGFIIKSTIAISLLALALVIVPFRMVTDDKLLVAVFGGFFLGAGIGFSIRGGAVIDGTEVLAIALSRKGTLSVGDFILIFNVIIFSVAAYLLTIEVALYSILTYLSASKTVDFILDGIEEFTGVTIISPHSDEIAHMIQKKLRRGLTIYEGKRGYGKRGINYDTIDIIFTVITRLEISRLRIEVEKIDPHAFIVMQSIRDTRGGMVKKRPLK
jgi:uncharacterized membrane-anchored protein YitT (DUF2179 family)